MFEFFKSKKRKEAEAAEAARLEEERLAAEKAEAERIAAEKAAAEKAEAERIAAEKAAAEKAEAERIAAEKAAAEKAEAERIAAEKAAAEKAEAERIAAEKAAAEKAEAERIAAEKAAAEKAEAERIAAEKAAAEKAEAERIAAEKAAVEKVAAEKAEAERIAAEKAAAEKAEAERIAAEKAETSDNSEKSEADKEAEMLAAIEEENRRMAEKMRELERRAQEAALSRFKEEQEEADRRAAAEVVEIDARRAEQERLEAEYEAQRLAAEKAAAEANKGVFKRLTEGLAKTRKSIVSGFESLFSGENKIDDDFYESIEEILVMSDVGVKTSDDIIESLKEKVKENKIKKASECRELLKQSIEEQMNVPDDAYDFINKKSVVMLIGVNGAGKTTTVGKLASQYKALGKKVMIAAADTFRAAAIDQVATWAERAGVELIAQKEGSDPAAVVFDAVRAAKSRDVDILICDTAGRLQNKKNLMDELNKIDRVITREYPEAARETMVVLDGATGQNALSQARIFNEAAKISGIVMTKLDGTAKGGIAIAVQGELGIPVKYIGVGEKIDDLQKFNPHDFVNALFGDDDSENESSEQTEDEQ
jgi:fused signal recognition particle receptor